MLFPSAPQAHPSTPTTPPPTFTVAVLRAALAKAHRQTPEHGARLDRAAAIIATRAIERIGGGWLVESEREPSRFYLVSQDGMGTRCMCPDYRQRGGLACKHMLSVKLLALCERLAARAETEQAPEPIPFPTPTLDPDVPIPFILTPEAEAALDAPAPQPA
jgi:hypothetical protein